MFNKTQVSSKPLKYRLEQALEFLQYGFIERDTALRLALLSLISGEHLLIIGAPGTAKSELARRLHQVLKEGDYFERLLTKFSIPEELFGPLSVKSLEQDKYHRQTKNYLPSASIAFIDEIFKANSAILNSLLTLLNEREFDNGAIREKVPLMSVIGASNELPEENELRALYDRFLCRYEVQPVSDDAFIDLLCLSKRSVDHTKKIFDYAFDLSEIQQISQQAMQLVVSDEVLDLLQQLRLFLREQSIEVSDRRWRKLIKLLKISAYTNSSIDPANKQVQVTVWDCFLLQHCLWVLPEQGIIIEQWYQEHLGMGLGFNQQRWEKFVNVWETTYEEESNSQIQVKNSDNELLYYDENKQSTHLKEQWITMSREGQKLYLAPPDNEDRSNRGKGYTQEELQTHFFDDYYQQCHIDGQWQTMQDYVTIKDNYFTQLRENKPILTAKKYNQSFVDKRHLETDELQLELQSLISALENQNKDLKENLQQHLWISKDFIQQIQVSLKSTLKNAQLLHQRMLAVSINYTTLTILD